MNDKCNVFIYKQIPGSKEEIENYQELFTQDKKWKNFYNFIFNIFTIC